MKAIVGRKVGMTQVFLKNGTLIPVTVIEVQPNVVLQKKTVEKDGYDSIKIGYEDKPERTTSKVAAGQFKQANTAPKHYIRELKGAQMNKYNVGDLIKADLFTAGELVDVVGLNKGKGFSGTIFRNNQHIGPKGHGSGYHRGVGSLATNGRDNNRVYPGKKMPGHEGNKRVTVLNLEVVAIDLENNALLIKGAVPGPKKGLLTIRKAVKVSRKKIEVKELIDYRVIPAMPAEAVVEEEAVAQAAVEEVSNG